MRGSDSVDLPGPPDRERAEIFGEMLQVACPMDASIVEVALISGGSAIIGPVLLSYLVNRQSIARERRLSERQDEVASRVSEVAVKAARVASRTEHQLGQIHTLVNSDMTAARQAELDQTRKHLTTLARLIEADLRRGEEPSLEDLEEQSKMQARASELEAILADRLVQLRAVDKK
jgi:hypothetical protein